MTNFRHSLFSIVFLWAALTLITGCAGGQMRGQRLKTMSQELAMSGKWTEALTLAKKMEKNLSPEQMAEKLRQEEIEALMRVYTQLGNHEKVFLIGDAFIAHIENVLKDQESRSVKGDWSDDVIQNDFLNMPEVVTPYLESALQTGEIERFDRALKTALSAMEYSMDMTHGSPVPEDCRYSYRYGVVHPLTVQRALLEGDDLKTFRAMEDIRISMAKMERCMSKRQWQWAKPGYNAGLLNLGVHLKDPRLLRKYAEHIDQKDFKGDTGAAALTILAFPLILAVGGTEAFYVPGTIMNESNLYFRTKKQFYFGYADYLEGSYQNAVSQLETYCQAISQTSALGGEYLWTAHDALGDCYENLGQPETAVEHYEKAVRIAETERSALQKDSYKRHFLKDRGRPYERLAIGYARHGEIEKAFAIVEKSKARALADLLEGKTLGKNKEVEASYLAFRTENVFKSSIGSVFADGGKKSLESPETASRSVRKAQEALTSGDKELASFVTAQSPSWNTMKPYFDDVTLVEFMLSEKEGLVFVGSTSGLQVHHIQQPEHRISAMVAELRRSICVETTDPRPKAQALYKALFGDAFPQGLPRRVVIVPHGPLHALPFTSLHDGQGWLVERSELSILPAAGILPFCREKTGRPIDSFLAFGNPDLSTTLQGMAKDQWALPGAEQEANELGALFFKGKSNPKVTILTGSDATESAFLEQAPRADIVHLACHGEFNRKSPSRSAMLLAGDKDTDGRLEAWEIMKVALNARFVTMSACETGIGEISVGDEVVGLTRGMLYAGTPALMSSLWKVSDEATSLLMIKFYEHLLAGQRPTKALQLAQLSLLGIKTDRQNLKNRGISISRKSADTPHTQFNHPLYWAAFQVTGDWK